MRRGEEIGPDELAIGGERRGRGFVLPDIPDEGISLAEVERELVRRALDKAGGNRAAAARLLGVERHKLLYRMEKYGIE
jgi:two-component system NtrC family response regulator